MNDSCRPNPKSAVSFFEFDAEEPVCEKCGCDAREPRYSDVVVQLAVIHFDPPDEKFVGRGKNYLACNPKRHVGGYMATGNTELVNCKKCKDTEAFKGVAADEDKALGTLDIKDLVGRRVLRPVFDDIGPEAGCCG